MAQKLTQEYLKECLTYDPLTGIFTWNERPLSHFKSEWAFKVWNSRRINTKAGSISPDDGYLIIGLGSRHYRSHRIAFLYMEGYLPENDVDHMDRDRLNNKWDNLREVSPQCNGQNCNLSKSNKSGVCGVTWDKMLEKWVAYVNIRREKKHLGYFERLEDAVMARYQEEVSNPIWTCSIESTAYKYLKDNNLLSVFASKDFTKKQFKVKQQIGCKWSCLG